MCLAELSAGLTRIGAWSVEHDMCCMHMLYHGLCVMECRGPMKGMMAVSASSLLDLTPFCPSSASPSSARPAPEPSRLSQPGPRRQPDLSAAPSVTDEVLQSRWLPSSIQAPHHLLLEPAGLSPLSVSSSPPSLLYALPWSPPSRPPPHAGQPCCPLHAYCLRLPPTSFGASQPLDLE